MSASSLMQVLTFLAQSFVFDVRLRKCHEGDDHNDRLRSQQGWMLGVGRLLRAERTLSAVFIFLV